MKKVSIFGVKINNITLDEATEIVEKFLGEDRLRTIYTPNTEIVMAAKDDENLKKIINESDLVIPDGIGLIYGSRIGKKPLKERVTGVDLSIKLLEIANKKGYRLYLLGGKDGVAKRAGENILKEYPNINIVGYHHGYFKGSHIGYKDHEEELNLIDNINGAKPDIIFVGLGFPKQEIWIAENKNRLNGRVIIGNGGTMDILSGDSKRAPEIFQRLGLEWLYRLIKEPSRIKRQIVLPKFIFNVLFSKDVIQ
ncbi:UDP-N-acetyl-D-mannosamine transferase [[Clostridium] ultunense Esp]|uniref:N-acetylglucosaminyldiphosphoundecaprenol N-acetyl-beta-D-mannosaminyltransferase n=1 Tax=[Clostridium] ultunense Esp TaxID=1288971 RepID=M1ZET6_9FIRM|nr:WecB/TagA/CpsF family glycosyltransferase [Schnuerera ultunensis]CCQ96819.1 UDP-N-acetyl-D-mannosamine transferase [[Clostridium] ultunense Esp]SHD75583.1 UDP-N-acetyl-D-mannosamine transferase [[Clostridium] ultunense Esp]